MRALHACFLDWSADWISVKNARKVLEELSGRIQGNPLGPKKIGINFGLHFTGGEPFLNFDLLLELVETAEEFNIPGTFVETNYFWCRDRQAAKERLEELKDSGLDGILITVNPFTLEHVPLGAGSHTSSGTCFPDIQRRNSSAPHARTS